ncbi:hypothetical protein ACFWP5_47790 [Streptomyces sp. NPDC058469]|uniref:hypothetical protein n=1 Tax=Streptomyces sp. NPDC058469 TaxID=3346514 RepID=UPI0036655994
MMSRRAPRLTLGLAAAVTASALVLALRAPAAETGNPVRVGRTCHSDLAPEYPISCGTYGFGDLRHACSRPLSQASDCPLTKALTVRNTGEAAVYVALTSGPRQGVRIDGRERLLPPGASCTLRPAKGGQLFDVTLRRAGKGPGVLRVTAVE